MKHIQQIIGWVFLLALIFLVGKWLFTTPIGIVVLLAICTGFFFYYRQKKAKGQKKEKNTSEQKTEEELNEKGQSNYSYLQKAKQTHQINQQTNLKEASKENLNSQKFEVQESRLKEENELKHVFDAQATNISESLEEKQKDSVAKPKPQPAVKAVTRFTVTTKKPKQDGNTFSAEIAPGLYSTMTTVGFERDMSRPRIINAPNSKNYIVLDTETTGLSRTHDRIIQLAALKFKDDKLIDTFNQYINPDGVPISEQARLVNGITEKEVYGKPKFSEIIPKFQKFVGEESNSTWVGHNINRFDIPIMFNNGYRQKPDYQANEFWTIDTYQMAKDEMSGLGLKNFKLETLKEYFDLHGNSHDALGDCQVTAALYQRLRDGNLARIERHPDKLLSGLRFSITGQFKEASRSELKYIITLHGGRVTGSVSHKTNYLLDGKQVSTQLKDGIHSSSELKAKEYGTKTIHYQDLMKMLAKSN